METELNELRAKHEDELLALRGELDDTVDEFSTLSYNSRVVCAFFILFPPPNLHRFITMQ